MERLFPYSEAGQIQLIREYGQLLSEEYTEGGIAVKQEFRGKSIRKSHNVKSIYSVPYIVP